jgi:hypothetical protein
MSASAARDFARLRAQVRAILLKEGTALAPGEQTPERVDDLIGDAVERHRPTLSRETDTLYARVQDRDLQIDISNHAGAIMAAYEEAGYFVGVAMGLEMAALALGVGTALHTKKSGKR